MNVRVTATPDAPATTADVCVSYAKTKVGAYDNPFIVSSEGGGGNPTRVVCIDLMGKVAVAKSADARKVVGVRPARYMAFQPQTADGKALTIESLVLKFYPLKAGDLWISIQDGNGGFLAEADIALKPGAAIQEATLQVTDQAARGLVLALEGENVLFPSVCFRTRDKAGPAIEDRSAAVKVGFALSRSLAKAGR